MSQQFKLKKLGVEEKAEEKVTTEAVEPSAEKHHDPTLEPPKKQSKLRLANKAQEPEEEDLPIPENACPQCKKEIKKKAVLCTSCGYNLKTGEQVQEHSKAPSSPFANKQEPKRQSSEAPPKRPLSIGFICCLVFLGAPLFIYSSFLDSTRVILGSELQYASAAMQISSLVIAFGLWVMRRWAAFSYIALMVGSQAYLSQFGLANTFSYIAVGVILFFIVINIFKFKGSENNIELSFGGPAICLFIGVIGLFFMIKPMKEVSRKASRAACISTLYSQGLSIHNRELNTVVCPISEEGFKYFAPKQEKGILAYCKRHNTACFYDGRASGLSFIGPSTGFELEKFAKGMKLKVNPPISKKEQLQMLLNR
ncbi:MAG: hypothetical protein NE334_20240 [Lentisphaeraceae bacterium]|nr:hypothetical protein [Lentisphaeraceae bacterium]